MSKGPADRRPISARNSQYSQKISAFLARSGVSPNAISIASVLFAAGAGFSLIATASNFKHSIWWVFAAVLIVLRLLANMFDGMVAMETGKASVAGELFNEVPDRISDVIIFVCAGFAAGSSMHLGYIAAILSLFVAYTRAFGNHMGVTGLFGGPMAKSQRMFTLVAFCLCNAVIPASWQLSHLLSWGLMVINLGCVITIVRRLQRIAVEMGP